MASNSVLIGASLSEPHEPHIRKVYTHVHEFSRPVGQSVRVAIRLQHDNLQIATMLMYGVPSIGCSLKTRFGFVHCLSQRSICD